MVVVNYEIFAPGQTEPAGGTQLTVEMESRTKWDTKVFTFRQRAIVVDVWGAMSLGFSVGVQSLSAGLRSTVDGVGVDGEDGLVLGGCAATVPTAMVAETASAATATATAHLDGEVSPDRFRWKIRCKSMLTLPVERKTLPLRAIQQRW